jgi:thiamine monophosphate kinase
MNRVKKAIKCPVTVVGEITAEKAGKVSLIDGKGRLINNKKTGWDHFGG